MTDPETREIVTYPFYELGDYKGKDKPNSVILREIDFIKTVQNPLEICFSGGEDLFLGANPEQEFKNLIDAVCLDNYKFRTPPPKMNDDYASPLSLKNGMFSYVIYKLSNKNWQFARKGYPVSVGAKGHPYVYDGYRLDKRGFDYKDKGATERDNCKVIYFIADGVSPQKDRKYDFPINLHINLVIQGTGGPRYIPIIIDPDVRYPGGSGQ